MLSAFGERCTPSLIAESRMLCSGCYYGQHHMDVGHEEFRKCPQRTVKYRVASTRRHCSSLLTRAEGVYPHGEASLGERKPSRRTLETLYGR